LFLVGTRLTHVHDIIDGIRLVSRRRLARGS
jgi:hypothetical protein